MKDAIYNPDDHVWIIPKEEKVSLEPRLYDLLGRLQKTINQVVEKLEDIEATLKETEDDNA